AEPFRALTYFHVPILDLTAPTRAHMLEAVRFIAEEAAKGTVYVHCKIGYTRSAAVVGAYLFASGQAATVDEALQRLHQVRPSITWMRKGSNGRLRNTCRRSAGAMASMPQHRGHLGIIVPACRPRRRVARHE